MNPNHARIIKIRACANILRETAAHIAPILGQEAQRLIRCAKALDEVILDADLPTSLSQEAEALRREEDKLMLQRRLTHEELRDTAQCRACLSTWPRNSLDWIKQKRVQIGTNDSWGNWKAYSNFLPCTVCGELAVGDESVEYGE